MGVKVVILQHRLLHYRVDFFEYLNEVCLKVGIELHLVHGQASENEQKKNDVGTISWAINVKNYFLRIGNVDLLWQQFPINLLDADLIILMQENRIVSNYPILLYRRLLCKKVAFWGHGANFQSKAPTGYRERWKRYVANKVDWWFAYTDITKKLLIKYGFPSSNITVLNNSIDTKKFYQDYESISENELSTVRFELGISDSSKVAVFCGSLYKDKKLDLLINSSVLLRDKMDYHLIIIGLGPEFEFLEKFSLLNKWVHLVGVKKGRDKAIYFKLSNVILNPGLLGLHILDSFAIGMPIVSTINAMHSPEIAYIENERNGVLVADDPEVYAQAIERLLNDPKYYNYISKNALEDCQRYTLDNMVINFLNGIRKCLAI
jgi:glycosyltransferase involved in cell wall biosynthesis